MASLMSLYGGGGGRRMVVGSGGGGTAAWKKSAAPVRRLLWRLRSSFRRSAARPRRAAVRFGYDPQSYDAQNFDDGGLAGSSGGHR